MKIHSGKCAHCFCIVWQLNFAFAVYQCDVAFAAFSRRYFHSLINGFWHLIACASSVFFILTVDNENASHCTRYMSNIIIFTHELKYFCHFPRTHCTLCHSLLMAVDIDGGWDWLARKPLSVNGYVTHTVYFSCIKENVMRCGFQNCHCNIASHLSSCFKMPFTTFLCSTTRTTEHLLNDSIWLVKCQTKPKIDTHTHSITLRSHSCHLIDECHAIKFIPISIILNTNK